MIENSEISQIDLINSVIAILGFIFSLLALYLNRKDKKPKLNISNSFGLLTFSDGSISDDAFVMIVVSNSNEKSVKATSIELEISGRKERLALLEMGGEVDLPKVFQVGDSHTFWKSEKELKMGLVERFKNTKKLKIRAVVNDGFGKRYKADKFLELNL